MREQKNQIKATGTQKKEELRKLNAERESLKSQQGQLLVQLKRMSSEAARGLEWLNENQDKFDKEVFGPPLLTCSINDPRYSDIVQSMLQREDFLCFTTQTKQDHKKLSDHFYGTMGINVTIRTCTRDYRSYSPPMPKEALPRFGLQGYVSDYLEGPEPVLAMLCAERKIHASAVSLRDISEEQFNSIQQGEVINQFAAGGKSYRIQRRREYGPGAVSTRTTQISRGQFWTDQPTGTAETTELDHKYDETKTEHDELALQFKEKSSQERTLQAEHDNMHQKIVSRRSTL